MNFDFYTFTKSPVLGLQGALGNSELAPSVLVLSALEYDLETEKKQICTTFLGYR